MSRKQVVALIFPANSAYSRGLTEGVIDRHFEMRDWLIVELPRYRIGDSPLPERRFHIDGAIVWAEPRDRYLLELLEQRVPVVNCGMEWGDTEGVMRVHLRQEDLHAEVIRHFVALGLRRAVVLGHLLEQRPATRGVLQSFVQLAEAAGLEAAMWDIGGTESPSASPRRLLEYEEEAELAAYLAGLPKPVGVYCCGDHIGYLVSEVARHLGLRVPQELAIVGIGANTICCLSHPPLSSVAGPARELGRVAAEQLARWFATGQRPAADVVVPGAILTERESTVGKSGQVVLEGIRRYLHEHAARGLQLNDLASFAKLSGKTLVRQYEEAYGINPLEEAQQLRLAEAKRLLAEPHAVVAEVAAACGFSSQAALYNYFKRHTGVGPSEFRAAAAPPAREQPIH
jgi:LacI family transcriptional regulator